MEEEKKELTKLEKAELIATRIEAANLKTEELVTRQENLRAEQIISGDADAGAGNSNKPTEDEQKDANARKMLEGSGFENDLFPQKE